MCKLKVVVMICIAVFVAGCATAPQSPIPLASNYYDQTNEKVGVYLDELPATDAFFPGADCLLCIAAASAMNASLTEHVQTLSGEELSEVSDLILKHLEKKGKQAVFVSKKINITELNSFSGEDKTKAYAKKDFRVLKDKLGLTRLVIVDINTLGVRRPYSSYIPTGAPQGYIVGEIYSIDLSTNQYELYEPMYVMTAVQGEWDEAPSFPGVTTAFYQALEIVKDKARTLFSI